MFTANLPYLWIFKDSANVLAVVDEIQPLHSLFIWRFLSDKIIEQIYVPAGADPENFSSGGGGVQP